ncbi:hypothetical protein GGR51DRAFT_122480 [Nemania sp. FL0031]|nr:hypothetical protein GGR51DRAFT_122480 [Nemania sp. FL0031]
MPHHHHRGRSIVATKGKEDESVGAAWPAPSDLHIISPRKSTRRPNLSESIFTQPQTTQGSPQTLNKPALAGGDPRDENHRSNTWTSSSENPDLPSEDGKDGREHFILEYNRLAERNRIRPLIPGDFSPIFGPNGTLKKRQGSWLSKMLRQASATKPENATIRHQHGTGDVSLTLSHSHKSDGLKNRDLRSLIRLCGKSPLFLPTDYAPFSLTLPTCIRALAQALVQHSDTRGIFRVPGSTRAVNALYEYYCTYGDTNNITTTTRCPMLPTHIRCNAHDIASTFKKFLAGLPGGILGSLSLFDALVAIHSQLQGNAELHWTKESKLRARLIALAIGTVSSQYQRELICAVFGLLCLVGRVAENAPREDESGHPLPTTDLMGYNALGIVFGPLLVGDMIDHYSMQVADPSAGLVLLPVSPRSRKERHRHRHKHKGKHRHRNSKNYAPSVAPSLTMDKIHIANSITEMLIVHWREVVRQIRSTGSVKPRRNPSNLQQQKWVPNDISPSVSEHYSLKNPPQWDHAHPRSATPSTASPTPTSQVRSPVTTDTQVYALDKWIPVARKVGISNSRSTQKQSAKAAPHSLSPTIEESPSPPVETPELTYKNEEAPRKIASEVSQKDDSISSGILSSRAHGSLMSTNGLEMIRNKSLTDAGVVIQDTASPPGAPKTESPSPPVLFARQNGAPVMPHRDAALRGSDQMQDIIVTKEIPSPNIKIDPPAICSDSPAEGTISQCGHDAGISNLKRIPPGDNGVKMSQMDLSDPIMSEGGSTHTDIDGKTVSGKGSLESLSLHDSYYDAVSGNGSPSKSIMDPHMYRRGRSRLMISHDPSYSFSELQGSPNRNGKLAMRSPADQWKRLMTSSKASTESLAQSAKDKRLKRGVVNRTLSRPSRESLVLPNPRPMTPEWKRLLRRETTESGDNRMNVRARNNTISEELPQLARPDLGAQVKRLSPDKYIFDTPHRRGSQRSASKPMPGAVKAMTALFNNAAKGSPGKSPAILTGRSRSSLRESTSFSRHDAIDESPTKSNLPRGNPSPNKVLGNSDDNPYERKPTDTLAVKNFSPIPKALNIRKSPNRPTIEDTPTRTLGSTLRPVQMFSSARKEPQASPTSPSLSIPHDQPPRLGTMVPFPEEPPVGHFMRPSSAASAQSRDPSAERPPPPLVGQTDSRQASGTSFLHAQIRSLQRQLAARNEEIRQLRRQLETQAHMDVGTLCEQLRVARRECMTWRRRAEAAEKRVAVFQRFSSRFQALRDGVDDDDESLNLNKGKGKGLDCAPDEASSCSVNTENREAFDDRIRLAFAKKMGDTGGDGAVFEDGDDAVLEYELHRGRGRDRSRRTTKLWEAAQELFDFQQDGGMRL